MDQWRNSTLMEMKQWVKSNMQFIKHCLGVALKQKQLNSLDIRNYINTKDGGKAQRKQADGESKRGNQRKRQAEEEKWSQKDIRDCLAGGRVIKRERTGRSQEQVKQEMGQENKGGSGKGQGEVKMQTIIWDFFKRRQTWREKSPGGQYRSQTK
eukprot:8864635-Ditylum_brightwellii.AAC.1